MQAASKSSLSVSLKDLTFQDIAIILGNLNFPTLVEPFRRSGVSGRMVSRISSFQEIIEFDKEKILKVVAQTFFEDHLAEWQSTGLVPKHLLHLPSSVSMIVKEAYSYFDTFELAYIVVY